MFELLQKKCCDQPQHCGKGFFNVRRADKYSWVENLSPSVYCRVPATVPDSSLSLFNVFKSSTAL